MRTRKKENRSKKMKPESTHSATFFLTKPKEDLAGGTTVAKTSPPLGDRSGIADTGDKPELEPWKNSAPELWKNSVPKLPKNSTPELQKKPAREPQKNPYPMSGYFKKIKTKSQDKEEKFNGKRI